MFDHVSVKYISFLSFCDALLFQNELDLFILCLCRLIVSRYYVVSQGLVQVTQQQDGQTGVLHSFASFSSFYYCSALAVSINIMCKATLNILYE